MGSILTETKKILGLTEDYTVYDLDIITHINATFSVLNQLGIGPTEGFFIDDDLDEWDDFDAPEVLLRIIRTYVFLKVRSIFDPPSTSYLIEAVNKQINEYEIRLSTWREWLLDPVDPMTVVEEEVEV